LDLVTSLQEAVGRLNAMLFNYVGALQRDAPPQSLKQEPVVAQPKAYDVQVGWVGWRQAAGRRQRRRVLGSYSCRFTLSDNLGLRLLPWLALAALLWQPVH